MGEGRKEDEEISEEGKKRGRVERSERLGRREMEEREMNERQGEKGNEE